MKKVARKILNSRGDRPALDHIYTSRLDWLNQAQMIVRAEWWAVDDAISRQPNLRLLHSVRK